MHMFILVAAMFANTNQTVSTQYIVTDTVTCHTRELTQGSGSVRICEYNTQKGVRKGPTGGGQ